MGFLHQYKFMFPTFKLQTILFHLPIETYHTRRNNIQIVTKSIMSAKRKALMMYRQVLRLHRQKLPAVQRSIGDKYVKEEFRAHQNLPEDSEFHEGFFSGWEDYCQELHRFKPMEGAKGWSKDGIREQVLLGRDLNSTEIAALSPEQKQQLDLLKQRAIEAKDKLYNES
jgi:hypothetical protein